MGQQWDRERCRVRYVEGDRIGLQALANLSGLPFGTLKRWSSQKPDTWFQQRRAFDEKTIRLAEKKSVERISDAIATSNEQVIARHLAVGKTLREISMAFFDAVTARVDFILNEVPEPEENERLLQFLIGVGGRCSLSVYANVAQIAIHMERQALYLDLADPSILEKAANRQGLSLVDLETK